MNQDQNRGLLFVLLGRLFKPLDGRLWLSSAAIVFLMLVGVTTYHLWSRYSHQILGQPQYHLKPELLKVTPQPEYIRSDVKASAVINGQLKGASLLEERIVLQVRQAFAVQPWVKEVLLVNKQYPSIVEVELIYRRPVAMVEIPAGALQGYDYEGLLPIDDLGVLLPVEVTETEAMRFPKIDGVDTLPAGPPGSPWGDTRVAEATHIILLLQEVWDQLGLLKIEVPERNNSVDAEGPEEFVLVTKERNRFNWGAAAGKEPPGHDSAKKKALGLRKFVEQHGTLDEWVKRNNTPTDSVSELLSRQRIY